MLHADAARDVLRQAGMRLTPQRLMIIDLLVGNRTHPTVDQLYLTARGKYPTLSLATVYHTVALLARHGLILELRGGKDSLRYDPDTAPHAHAYCGACGAVDDITLPAGNGHPCADLHGFQADVVEVSMYGTCTRCTTDHTGHSSATAQ